jgi:hypothetical protein
VLVGSLDKAEAAGKQSRWRTRLVQRMLGA